MTSEKKSVVRAHARGYIALMCSHVKSSFLLYVWVFSATLLCNSVFTGVEYSYRGFPDFSGIAWYAYFAFAAFAFAVLGLDMVFYRGGRIFWNRHMSMACLYIAAAGFSIVFNRGEIADKMPFYNWLKLIVPFVFCFFMLQNMRFTDIRRICLVLTAFACLNLFVAFFEMLLNSGNLVTTHISAAFSDRNLLARFLIIVHIFLCIEFLGQEKHRLFSFKPLILAAIFVCIVMLMSRSGYLLYLFSTVMIFLNYKSAKLKKLLPVFVAAAVVLFGAMFMIRVRTEKMNISNASDIGRAGTMLAGIRMIKAHPVTGIGYSMANGRFTEFQDRHFPGISDMQTIHNAYINAWAEAGLLGLAAFLALNAGILLPLRKACRTLPFGKKKLHLFCYLSLSIYLIHGVFYHTFDYEGIYWVIIACSLIILRDSQGDRSGT
jgi:O-antigen ligase